MPWCAASKAGRGPTRVLRVVAHPAFLGVAHVGEAAQEAAAWGADAARGLHHERDDLELLDLQRVVVVAAALGNVALARVVNRVSSVSSVKAWIPLYKAVPKN